jgi:hypothetical protein
LAPNKDREIGGGRATRQPGQVRKEAALTRSGSGRSSVSYLFFSSEARQAVGSVALEFAASAYSAKVGTDLLRNQVYADCVYLSALEYAQVKFRKSASRDNQVRIDR